jgi:putative intracellular protease/amidase
MAEPKMKKIVIVIFDHFTDLDLFLMWDILGRNKKDWHVMILGTKEAHQSANGLVIKTHGNIKEANDADVVLFSSGKVGVKAALADQEFMRAFSLNPDRQLIGSICAGSFILAKLGLLALGPATTHPDAKLELQATGIEVLDLPLICKGNVATAGGCLSAVYLVGWVIEILFGRDKREESLREIIPAGQSAIYERLIDSSIRDAVIVTEGVGTTVVRSVY